ncbi:MAG: tRNA (guanosine(37)-N1)-methyltransferase TrmD [Lachnospiraceae bacterium]|nr:tRNA (guanosine(37)-N1)-methyltransferase TrmD [Lachnospiraceae bacterium]
MNFYIMTLFPDMIMNGLNTSIIGKAMEKNLLSINAIDIRDFTTDKHRHVDDYPYGGGAGMVMQAQPVYDCYKHVETLINENSENTKKARVLFMTPTGRTFNQDMAKELSTEDNLVFLCGHYEGIDKRVLDKIVTDEVSIGDFVLTGGELPAMVMIDAISRHIPGVLNNDVSAETETFTDNLLEYPQYTRPEVWEGEKVPDVLLSGHHANIEKWRREQSLLLTRELRPDLFEKVELTKKDKKFLEENK